MVLPEFQLNISQIQKQIKKLPQDTFLRQFRKETIMIETLPNDPIMLLSAVNTLLRDYFPTLQQLCENFNTSQTALEEKLTAIGYQYDSDKNQFV